MHPAKRALAVTVLVLIGACMIGCREAPTSVRLTIVAAPSLSLDGLTVTVHGTRHQEPMTESLLLLVPDDWAGVAQRIEVEGTSAGAALAVGAILVTPIRKSEVAAVVTLVDARCDLVCNVGAVQCDVGGVATCELGLDGCPSWSAPEPCPDDAPFCTNGMCSSTCSDECATGESMCVGAGSVRVCGEADNDPCLDWRAPTMCPGDEVCAGDACSAAFAVTVVKAGAGTGTVTSVPTGIVCGSDCVESYAAGTTVTLTASPSAGAVFSGWSGAGCSGAGPCVFDVNDATTVTATFTGACTDECVEGDTGCADAASVRVCEREPGGCLRWSEPTECPGSQVCSSDACTPVFALTVVKAGAGCTVTSAPSGINCGAMCTKSYIEGTQVTLTATASGGAAFSGWSGGGCSGTAPCTVTMTAAKTVTATCGPRHGRADVVLRTTQGTLVGLSTGTSFSALTQWLPQTSDMAVGDVNGDGRDDLVLATTTGTQVALSTGSGFGPLAVWQSGAVPYQVVGDVNGDGLADLVLPTTTGTQVALSTGASFGTRAAWHADSVNFQSVGDVNGDGRADLVLPTTTGTQVALSTGTSFGPRSVWHADTVNYQSVGDVNGDGLADIVLPTTLGTLVALSTGTSFGPRMTWHAQSVNFQVVGDVNGDGMADVVMPTTMGLQVALSTGTAFGPLSIWSTQSVNDIVVGNVDGN